MKKTLAALMAAAIVATGMTAFADDAVENDKYTQDHAPGQTVEIVLEDLEVEASNLRISNGFSAGRDAIESMEIGKTADKKDAFIMKLKTNYTTKSTGIVGTVTLKNKNNGSTVKTLKFDFSVAWNKAEIGSDAELDITLNNETPVYEFASSNKRAAFSFSDVDAYYTVRLESQAAVNMYYTTEAVKSIVQANENADLYFLNYKGAPSFDFTGELVYNVVDPEGEWFLYEINSENKLVKTKATYNKEDGTLTLKTKTLGSYVISDTELKAAAATDSNDKTENPNTGSVDFVNVAVALAVVSLAAAGAVAMKKAK